MDKPKDAANIIKKYGEVLRMKEKDIITVVYHQGKVFSRFRVKEKFMKLVSKFKVRKNTIDISNILKEYVNKTRASLNS